MSDKILQPIPGGSWRVARPLKMDEISFLENKIRAGEEWNPYFFTFGFGQAFPNGMVVVYANSMQNARLEMDRLFGTKWSMSYDLEGMENYASRYPADIIGVYVSHFEGPLRSGWDDR
jgi:hypothetical protein